MSVEAMIDAGLVRCDSCRAWNEPRNAAFNCDGSRWFCATAADGEPPCSLEETPCKDCLQPKGNLDLDMDGSCGCVADAAWWVERVQALAARQTARAA